MSAVLKLQAKTELGDDMSGAISRGLQSAIGKDQGEMVLAILTEVRLYIARRCTTDDRKLSMAYRVLFFRIFG
jgi:hypothetical protein